MSEKSEEKGDKKVKIEVDSHPKHVTPGVYVVANLKELVDVPTTKDLDQVIDGALTTLSDIGSVTINGGEVFFSHARRGGSS
jgi:hypothetical protein